jgi:hypothetical protein
MVRPLPRGRDDAKTEKCQFVTEECQFVTEECQFVTEKCQLVTQECQFITEERQFVTEECQFLTEKCQFIGHRAGYCLCMPAIAYTLQIRRVREIYTTASDVMSPHRVPAVRVMYTPVRYANLPLGRRCNSGVSSQF